MKQLTYSSTAAFLAHYRILSNSSTISGQDRETLELMHQLMDALTSDERDALRFGTVSTDGKIIAGPEFRRQQRARLKLQRLLLAEGVVRG
jgi:hypothetical protein